MRGITNSRARTLGKKELRKVFKECRFKDGLTEREEADAEEFLYYYNKARDGKIGNYIIYEVVDSDPVHRADDVVIAREFYCQIDVFSVRSFETKQLIETLLRLEEKLLEHRFGVELQGEEFEPDTRLYRQVIFATKMYA